MRTVTSPGFNFIGVSNESCKTLSSHEAQLDCSLRVLLWAWRGYRCTPNSLSHLLIDISTATRTIFGLRHCFPSCTKLCGEHQYLWFKKMNMLLWYSASTIKNFLYIVVACFFSPETVNCFSLQFSMDLFRGPDICMKYYTFYFTIFCLNIKDLHIKYVLL